MYIYEKYSKTLVARNFRNHEGMIETGVLGYCDCTNFCGVLEFAISAVSIFLQT